MAGKSRTSHSLDAVLGAALSLLDESGENALTFRALAARLGGGVGSIYWYVSSKDELLDRAADRALGEVMAATDDLVDGPDPIENLRAISLALFDELVRRPWLGTYLMSNNGGPTNSLRFFDRAGQQLMKLGLPPRELFHGTGTLITFIVGVAVDMGQDPPKEFLESGLEPEEFMAEYAQRWRNLDPAEFPFLHQIAEVFATHDDAEVFRSGLDLLLTGLRQQADRL